MTADAFERPLTLRRAFRTCLVASAFALFWGVAFALAWVVLPLVALFVRDEVRRIRRCQRIIAACFRFFHGYMRTLTLFDAKMHFDIPGEGQGPRVIVANHTTLVDVTVLMAHHPHICCIVKPIYYDNFLVGRAARLGGFIPGRVGPRDRTTLDMAQKRLNQGFDVLVFPEGTRSPPGGILPFHRGAFVIAKRASVPITPLFLRCFPTALTKGQAIWQQPDTAAILRVVPLEMVDAESLSGSSRDLCDRVQRSYHAALLAKAHDPDQPRSRDQGAAGASSAARRCETSGD